jgi:hypothetical protein
MNQSRPRRLSRDGDAGGGDELLAPGPDDSRRSPSLPTGRALLWSIGCLDECANRLLLRFRQWSKNSGCKLPDAPSTTIGVSSLYSGAAVT